MNKIKLLIFEVAIAGCLMYLMVGCQMASGNEAYDRFEKVLGMSFVAANEPVTNEDIVPLKEIGVTWVSLMPYGFVRNIEHELRYNTSGQWWGERDEGLEETARLAHTMDLKVMLKPQVWFRKGEYTGAYLPPDSAALVFKKSFTEFVLHYAEVANKIDADLYCIGTEWHRFIDDDPDYWQRLIIEVRGIYKGQLTYAANWDEYKTVPFWSELDFIGINAYFPISEKKFPLQVDLQAGWEKWHQEIAALATNNAMPVLFTEYGYRSIISTAENPWESYTKPAVSMNNQSLAYKALYDVFWDEPWFAGGFAWKWFHNYPERGGQEHIGFTPQNKPVEEVIKSYYKNTGK